jgi:lipopolysaccharide/colanic/teichoic acid biosynthesis glycosyltransferase
MNKKIIILVIAFILMGIADRSWAVVTMIDTQVAPHQTSDAQILQPPQKGPVGPRSVVPEPSSLVLFGSGILSMVIAFLRRSYDIGKRALDVIFAVFALIFLFPFCLLVAILVKSTSHGPVFYIQIRSGKDGKNFDIYKFRTMTVNAEKESGPVWAKLKDDRITPIGQFLRKSRIDEIPQFINVLKGDMSVIGPRPERPVIIEKLKSHIRDYPKRLIVKPGITGLAQVYHRYDESISDVRKKVKYDILYIKRMSISTDLSIVARTLGVILSGFGAH